MRHLLDDPNWLHKMYIIKNLSTTKIGKIVNRSPKLVSMKLKKYGIRARKISDAMLIMSDQISQTNRENWQKKEYKDKITQAVNKTYINEQLRNKTKQHSIKYWSKDISKQKASISSKEKWTKPEYREKLKNAVSKAKPAVKKKCKKASQKNWKNDEYRKKVTSATKKACNTEKWKEDTSTRTMTLWQSNEYRDKIKTSLARVRETPEYKRNLALGRLKQPSTSYEERIVSTILTEFGISHKKVVIGPHEFDVLIDLDKPILLEIQGEYWHPKNKPHDKSKHTYFQRYLSDKYRLLYLYDYDFCSNGLIYKKLTDITGINISTKTIKARHLEFKEVNRSDYKNFYSKYHYIGNQGKWGYTIGGYFNKTLICCVTYSGCTRKQISDRLGIKTTEVRELSRLCRHPLFVGRNMLSKLISQSIKMIQKHRPEWKCLVTYADQTRGHTGSVYKSANWTYDGDTPASYHYLRENHITYKKTLWDRSKKMSMNEKEYAKKHNFIKIPEKPKSRFLYYLQ